ncbi:hypothetical protein ABWH89_02085 [Hoeflea alexandrii]|uniref:hypothetical protein n=1 Tax=Hoeflea alexandrii TaxID=288436 RepID=UPI0035CF4449
MNRNSPKYVIASFLCLSLLLTGVVAWIDHSPEPEPYLIPELHARFDPLRPGYGATDYPGNAAADVPKSYAKILIAELERTRNGLSVDLPNLAPQAGRWLLDNSDLDKDGVVGWGVPIAWDAYGDGSENPANTAYTISTAITVQALLDWMEQDPNSPGPQILAKVDEALRPFVDPEMRTPAGLLPYSFVETDRQYDTFNPAAYLAGELQRFSLITPDKGFAAALRGAADDTVQALLDYKMVNPETGSWYWRYSVQENVSNDLPHASYIIHGLLNYIRYEGELSAQIDFDAVLAHIKEFEAPDSTDREGYIRGWPLLQENIERSARTYDIGMALSLLCNLNYSPELSRKMISELVKYKTEDGAYLKYPVGSEYADPLVVNEYEAYLYRGVVACEAAKSRNLKDSVTSVRLSDTTNEFTPGADNNQVIPFVRPFSGEGRVELIATPAAISVVHDGSSLSFEATELPLAIFPTGNGNLSITRTLPDDRLLLKLLSSDGSETSVVSITASADTQPMLRAARLVGQTLYLVYYDNIAQGNFLERYLVRDGEIQRDGKLITLPLLLDPAGGTYEMIPWVDVLASDNAVHIVGGTLNARIIGDVVEEGRMDGCHKIIEAVATPSGPAALCLAAEGAAEPYFVVAPSGVNVPRIQSGVVPYNLSFRRGSLSIKHADDPDSYREMLLFDIERIQQNGWLEYGISNAEARIPWSQIYYLNGFLDFIYLAERNDNMADMIGDIVPGIRRRLDLEMAIIDQHWREGRFQTRAFTIDRSPALFAVQTSRLLLLMDRYLNELQAPVELEGYGTLLQAVHCLEDHIDTLAYGVEPLHWLSGETANLRWEKGGKFYFDGVAVPFNHQNEWAYSVLETRSSSSCPEAEQAAIQIIKHFQRRIAPDGELPANGVWDYWWGTAYDGWQASDGISINKPEYPGDHIKAWISFRSIDAMSNLAASTVLPEWIKENLLRSASYLVASGKLYPFVNYELTKHGKPAVLKPIVAMRYARINSPWDLQSAAWAYLALANEAD